ncbi:hypothetical protein [Flavobacterium sp. UBA4854]|uniref:hypothetical protein n=1 Tax=Flavobacterium sp. UBA4854 TaxID=1946548 RepID=UPI00257AE710|nr:hypothetical protein [Flavobacterium sp. UBA4854]
MKDKFYSILVLFIAVFCCKNCSTEYIKGGDNKAISNYEKMLFDNSTIQAELYDEYKETTIKIAGIPMKTYKFRYHFDLNGNTYEGEHTFDVDLPKSNKLTVYYLKGDPDFNLANPKSELAKEKEKNSSNSSLYWAIGWGIFSLMALFGVINEFKKKPESETEIETAE